jgi:hypothetical protein
MKSSHSLGTVVAGGVARTPWFGPLGVGSLYYATYIDRFDLADEDRCFAVVSLSWRCRWWCTPALRRPVCAGTPPHRLGGARG